MFQFGSYCVRMIGWCQSLYKRWKEFPLENMVANVEVTKIGGISFSHQGPTKTVAKITRQVINSFLFSIVKGIKKIIKKNHY